MRGTTFIAIIFLALLPAGISAQRAEATVIAPAPLRTAAAKAELSQKMTISCSYRWCGRPWYRYPYYRQGYYRPYDVPYYGYYRPLGWSDLNRRW
jgi:hypothetical protein